MRKTTLCRALVIVATATLTTACAHVTPFVPVTTLVPAGCAATPDLARAQPIVLDPKATPLEQDISELPCAHFADGSIGSYHVYRLPAGGQSYTVSVESLLTGSGWFSPRILLLNAAGQEVRQVKREQFSKRGSTLQATVFFKADNGDEQYMVVAADSSTVGKSEVSLSSNAQTSYIGTGYWMQGTENRQTISYSYNGHVRISAKPRTAVAITSKPSTPPTGTP